MEVPSRALGVVVNALEALARGEDFTALDAHLVEVGPPFDARLRQVLTALQLRDAAYREVLADLALRSMNASVKIETEALRPLDRAAGAAAALDVANRIGHLCGQNARRAQSVLRLLGASPGRQWPQPVPLVNVVRAAVGRVAHYQRIEVCGEYPDLLLTSDVVEAAIHVLAELMDNATTAAPSTMPVTVRCTRAGSDWDVQVEDRGRGFHEDELPGVTAMVQGRQTPVLFELGCPARLGFPVVGLLARQYRLPVTLTNLFPGVRATVRFPSEFLLPAADDAAPAPDVSPAADADVQDAPGPLVHSDVGAPGHPGGLPRRVPQAYLPALEEARRGVTPATPAPGRSPEEEGAFLSHLRAGPPEVPAASGEAGAAGCGSPADVELPDTPPPVAEEPSHD